MITFCLSGGQNTPERELQRTGCLLSYVFPFFSFLKIPFLPRPMVGYMYYRLAVVQLGVLPAMSLCPYARVWTPSSLIRRFESNGDMLVLLRWISKISWFLLRSMFIPCLKAVFLKRASL